MLNYWGYRVLPLVLKAIVKPLKFKANHWPGNLLLCASHALFHCTDHNKPTENILFTHDHQRVNLKHSYPQQRLRSKTKNIWPLCSLFHVIHVIRSGCLSDPTLLLNFLRSLLVLQNSTTARKIGNILLTYLKAFSSDTFVRHSSFWFSDECRTKKAFKYVKRMLPLFRAMVHRDKLWNSKTIRTQELHFNQNLPFCLYFGIYCNFLDFFTIPISVNNRS